MIWNKERESIAKDKIKKLQLQRLKDTVNYVYNNVPFYRKKFEKIGLKPEHIKKLKDIQKIPLTTKEDLRDNYPYDLLAQPMENIVRLHASSGTTGKPVVVGYTENDLKNWTECVARLITAAGASRKDIAQIAFGYGMFTGGFGLHYGLEEVGVTVIPASSGNSERQIMRFKDFGATILISTPSYALYLAEVANDMGVKKEELNLKLGLFGGEGMTESIRDEIEERWGISDTQNYGLTEIVGPGVSGECEYKNGMHINEDHFYPEIIDPDSEEVLNEGEKGELILTNLSKEGIPMLRYRTKDITRLISEPCDCGRTSIRMSKVEGRTDDMLIIKGVNVFPSQIEEVLFGIDHIGPHYQIIVKKDGYMDDIEIKVELVDGSLLDKYSELEKLRDNIKKELRKVLQIEAKVKLVEPRTIERTSGKAEKVVDLRGEQN